MNLFIMIAVDLAAIALLTFGLYLRRHRRRDLAVSYLGINVGVFAVAAAMSTTTAASLGFGLGLFGVLSIIRLRSTELEQHEVAYYFSSLALGLLAGIGTTSLPVTAALMALILAVMFVGDHPRVLPSYRHQVVVLDQAVSDGAELTARLEELLGGRVHSASVRTLDLVNDKTTVDVRFSAAARQPAQAAGRPGVPAAGGIPSPHRPASELPGPRAV